MSIDNDKTYRVLDANFNRLREGLRVVEEVQRLVRDDPVLAKDFKAIRHQISACYQMLPLTSMLAARDSENDIGKDATPPAELKRTGLSDITVSNLKRCQEAARVLEEFTKLVNPEVAKKIKGIRFDLYSLEKRILEKCDS
jgi:thiamine-phosphate pyrophosphorylase